VVFEPSFGGSFRVLDIGKKNQYARNLDNIIVSSGLCIEFPKLLCDASFLPLRTFREIAAADLGLQTYPEESI
jgi:hypothetical protein